MNKSLGMIVAGIGVPLGLAIGIVPVLDNEFWTSIFILILINILLTSSLRTIYILDQVSLGHVGFTLIGAYASALLVMKLGIPFWAAMILAGLCSGLVALVLGYPFLRLKGIYFSILTFMTAEIFRLITYNWRAVTGGQYGLSGIPAPGALELPFVGTITFDGMTSYYYLTLAVVVISLGIIYLVERSHLSQKWRAIRDADGLALAVGVNIMGYKVINFTIASFFAGIAGALFAHYQRGLSVDITSRFGVMMSLYLVVYMVIGGKDRFVGPIIGTLVIELFSEIARPIDAYRPMLIGAIAIVVALLMPEGLAGIPNRIKDWRKPTPAGRPSSHHG